MCINKKYYNEKLVYKINEIVIFRDKFHRIIFDHNDGNVNLRNCDNNIIFNVPKMYLFKNKELEPKEQIRSSSFGFIYEKDNEKRVFNLDDSKKYHSELIQFGWKHIDTIDLCLYVEYLIKEIKLKNK
jgi:hypothetical protein